MVAGSDLWRLLPSFILLFPLPFQPQPLRPTHPKCFLRLVHEIMQKFAQSLVVRLPHLNLSHCWEQTETGRGEREGKGRKGKGGGGDPNNRATTWHKIVSMSPTSSLQIFPLPPWGCWYTTTRPILPKYRRGSIQVSVLPPGPLHGKIKC